MVFDIISNVIGFLSSIKDAIIAFLEGIAGLARTLAEIARSTIEYIWNGVRTLLDLILETVKYIWNTISWMFTSIMDMTLTGITNIVRLVQCGLTSVYRRFKERIPVLLMYNSMIAYTRRIIERGEPLDFLKVPLMGFGAGIMGVMISGLIPNIPSDVCVNVTPLQVEEYRTVTPGVPRVPVTEYPTFSDRISVEDKLEYKHIPAQVYTDTVTVTDRFYYEVPTLVAMTDRVEVVENFIAPPPKESVSTDVVHVDDELKTSAERSRASTDISTTSDTMGYSVIRAQKMRDSVGVSDSFSYEVEKGEEQA